MAFLFSEISTIHVEIEVDRLTKPSAKPSPNLILPNLLRQDIDRFEFKEFEYETTSSIFENQTFGSLMLIIIIIIQILIHLLDNRTPKDQYHRIIQFKP